MIFKLYAVKDTVSGQFSKMELFNNEQVALRYYNSLLKESKIACDLQFYCLGDYNVETGEITPSLEFVQGGAISE